MKAINLSKNDVWGKKYFHIGVLVFSVFCIYGITLWNNPNFYWDDKWMVIDNYFIKSLAIDNITDIFSKQYQAQYSPVNTLLYAFVYQIVGLDAFSFHLVCILLHLGNSILVYFFVSELIVAANKTDSVLQLSTDSILPVNFLVALLFAISPMQIESVAWISASKIVLSSFFFLLGLIVYIKYVSTKRVKYILLCFLYFFLSYGSKEQAVVFPIALLSIDYYIFGSINLKSLIRIAPFFLLAVFFGFFSFYIQETGYSVMLEKDYYPLWQRLFFACYSITQYIVKILLPIRLWVYYPFPIEQNQPLPFYYFVYPVTIVAIGYFVIRSFIKRQKVIVWGTAFFLLNIFLTLHIVPMGRTSIMANRYVYLSCIGLFFIGVKYLNKYLINKPTKELYMTIGCLTIYILLTFVKSIVYMNEWDVYWIKRISEF